MQGAQHLLTSFHKVQQTYLKYAFVEFVQWLGPALKKHTSLTRQQYQDDMAVPKVATAIYAF
ncbi:MAG: hypothetical protein RLZZ487_260 [Pseudomonadota bacterium]